MSNCPKQKGMYSAKTDFLTWTERDAIRKAVFERDIPFCVWCQREVGTHKHDRYFTADHIIPRSDGGAYEEENLVLSCKECNMKRGNKSVLMFAFELFASKPGKAVSWGAEFNTAPFKAA